MEKSSRAATNLKIIGNAAIDTTSIGAVAIDAASRPATTEREAMQSAATDAIEHTVRTARPGLLRFIERQIDNTAEAEDILQDVFYQLLESYNVTAPIEKLTAWLYTVARNKVIDWYRKKRPERLSDENVQDEALWLAQENITSDSLIWEAITEALEELPIKQRDVFIMHEVDGMSFKEISEITGDSVNTLLSRKRYAVLFLRKRLQSIYEELYG